MLPSVSHASFQASDRRFVLAAGNDRLFARACAVIGYPEWVMDQRFATNEARVENRSTLVPLLADALATRTAAEWLETFADAGVPCSPIRAMDEVFASPEGAALIQDVTDPQRGPLRLVADPIRFDGQTLPVRFPPPTLGEHSELLNDQP